MAVFGDFNVQLLFLLTSDFFLLLLELLDYFFMLLSFLLCKQRQGFRRSSTSTLINLEVALLFLDYHWKTHFVS